MPAAIPRVCEVPRDAKDEKYVNLAVAGTAQFPVSGDRHLLDLRAGDTPEARAVRDACPTLRIVTPVEFLREVQPTR